MPTHYNYMHFTCKVLCFLQLIVIEGLGICNRTNQDRQRKPVVANEEAEAAHVENDWEEDQGDR